MKKYILFILISLILASCWKIEVSNDQVKLKWKEWVVSISWDNVKLKWQNWKININKDDVKVWWNIDNIKDGVKCTQEAKLCPDGSYVQRVGPNCEFQKCPSYEKEPLQDDNEDLDPDVLDIMSGLLDE